MGCCAGGDKSEDEAKVEAELVVAKQQDRKIKKVLFLGPGGSGKSTLFKQLRTIHGQDLTTQEREIFRDHIFTFIMETCQWMIKSARERGVELPPKAQEAAEFLEGIDVQVYINERITDQIRVLWDNESIKEVFEEEAKLRLDHSCGHFFDNIERIGSPSYLPTDKDILMQRRPTTGLIEQTIEVDGHRFNLYDVGGQKNERRKWEHAFENVSVVIFVVALSSYDENMYEDETTNSMQDGLELFTQICTSNWFVSQDMILFLNKSDLFAEKIESGIPLTECPILQDFEGGAQDVDAARDHIVAKFKDAFDSTKKRMRQSTVEKISSAATGRNLFVHVTCAYEGDNIRKVFNDVQSSVLSKSFAASGLG